MCRHPLWMTLNETLSQYYQNAIDEYSCKKGLILTENFLFAKQILRRAEMLDFPTPKINKKQNKN